MQGYKEHYYYNDIEDIIQKIKDNKVDHLEKSHGHAIKDEFGRPFIGEFVPYNVGMRLEKTIYFKL